MSLTIQLYEETSTGRVPVNNIGWRSAGTSDETFYVYNPIIRPSGTDIFSYSFKKYNYAKIEGTYPLGSRPRIKITNSVTGAPPDELAGCADGSGLRIYYKLTNTFETPNDQFDGELIYLPPGETILYPSVSTTGPNSDQGYPQYLAGNTTYYTQYLVTQLFVNQGTPLDFGNIGEVNIEWYIDEYEDTNV